MSKIRFIRWKENNQSEALLQGESKSNNDKLTK
jgi:hypothetical protein